MNRAAPDALALELTALLAQCALKNQNSFNKLYQLTASKLYGVALRILRRQDWAEEVLQECYVNIWNHAGAYAAAKSAPLTWMTSIVRNRCLNWLRRPRTEATGEEYGVAIEARKDDAPAPPLNLVGDYGGGSLYLALGILGAKTIPANTPWYFLHAVQATTSIVMPASPLANQIQRIVC